MRPTTEETAEIEYQLISTEEGQAFLAEVALVDKPEPTDFLKWRKGADAETVSAAVRLAAGRKKGAAKFSRADRMWFEPLALEQSTSELVATHKARRFAGFDVVDLCSGIGGDTIALAKKSQVLAVDRDPGMVRRMIWNAAVHDVEKNVEGVASSAESFAIPEGRLVHIDPDRRSSGKRQTRRIAEYIPDLLWLRSMMSATQGGAIKLGPASDVFEQFKELEIEVISLNGECKEATVWFGSLATCHRRATVLPGGATWTNRGEHPSKTFIGDLGDSLYEPDAALVRAGLLNSFAIEHKLRQFSFGLPFLTGDRGVLSPFLTEFAVIQELPLDNKVLRHESRTRHWGPIEVKSRGLKPEMMEKITKGIHHSGSERVTLFLLNPEDKSRAIVAQRV